MKNLKAISFIALPLVVLGTVYAQEHRDHNAQSVPAKSDAPEIFCSHKGTGQLCPGNAQMFKLGEAQKQRYSEALNNYNKAVAAASKQFLADTKDKVGLSQPEQALAESWFAEGLNPEINKILATKSKK